MRSKWVWAALPAVLTAAALRAGQDPEITIRVVNSAGVAARTLAEGEKQAGWVLAQAAVRIVWRDCTVPGACKDDPAANEFWLHVANWKPSVGSERELGFTTFDPESASGVGVAGIYYPMVRELARGFGMEEGLILAAALAHETGHALGAGHSATGIMRAMFNRQNVVDMSKGGLLFSRSQAVSIRAEALRRNSEPGRPTGSAVRAGR